MIHHAFLSTLSLRRATDTGEHLKVIKIFLSTLSLRRATSTLPGKAVTTRDFYPRSPCGERHNRPYRFHIQSNISIHALLAESDIVSSDLQAIHANFYPRSPCGERPAHSGAPIEQASISIHALLAESDLYSSSSSTPAVHFYPRSPCGERLSSRFLFLLFLYFYPRSPCGERLKTPCVKLSIDVFLSTLSLRRATIKNRP